MLIALLGVHKLNVKAGWETERNFNDDDNDHIVVSGSHKNSDGDCSVLGYDAVSSSTQLPTFMRSTLPPKYGELLGLCGRRQQVPRNIGNYLPIYTESYPRILTSSLKQQLTFTPKRRNKILYHMNLLPSLRYILQSG